MTRKGGGVLQEPGVGDYRWTDRQGWIVQYIVIYLPAAILASLYMFTNRVLRTSVSFAEDCLVALVDPVVVDDHLRVNQAIKAWSLETETLVTSEKWRSNRSRRHVLPEDVTTILRWEPLHGRLC